MGPIAGRRMLAGAATLSVGVVLADSSIVTLALPAIITELDTSVVGVSWVLTAFNVALAAAIVPAAGRARRDPGLAWGAGLGVFALASLACALAGSAPLLVAARVVQAIGGALALAGAIESLARLRGSHLRAAPLWGAAGTIGLALGPAAGGLLTELLSWQAIFAVQVPLLIIVPFAIRSGLPEPETGPRGARGLLPELALGLISAGLTGALFLLVILLTEGWGLSPLAAAATVSAMPLAAAVAHRLTKWAGPPKAAALAGGIAIAGGLTALAFLPGESFALTLEPQLLIGAGLALALPVLTMAALGARDPRGARASTTLAARHAGIVLGIVVLAPVISAQLDAQQRAATAATTALLLDAPLPLQTRIDLGAALQERIEAADGRLPDVDAAFGSVSAPEDAQAVYGDLHDAVRDQVERAATHAFSAPFLIAAGFSILALLPIGLLGRTERRSRWAPQPERP